MVLLVHPGRFSEGFALTFRQLVNERGWSPTRYEKWLVEAGKRLLLPAPVEPS